MTLMYTESSSLYESFGRLTVYEILYVIGPVIVMDGSPILMDVSYLSLLTT